MKKHTVINAVCAGLLATTAFAAPVSAQKSATAEPLAVRRVTLSTSGLAHFEMRTRVTDDATVSFPVRLGQVDDILKSLIVLDAKGRLGGVTLPSRQPLAEVFRDLPFSQDQLTHPMLLLNAYQGAEVQVTGPEIQARGRIVHVSSETVTDDDGRMQMRHRLSLMTDQGLRHAVIEELDSIRFQDDRARTEITRALDALRDNDTAGQRRLSVRLLGQGPRDVALSYVVDAPLWKAAYRMVMPAEGADKGLLQGWAVIENVTAHDWKDVDLTLVSGNPVTYKQALYESYYVQRPEIPVEVFGRVLPRVDTGVVAGADMAEGAAGYGGGGYDGGLRKSARSAQAASSGVMAMAAPAPMMMESVMADSGIGRARDMLAQAANTAVGQDAATQVLFHFPDRFSLKTGETMMLPFVSRAVPMERVALYQPETHETHPLAALRLENDGDTGLPPGIVTLYEDGGKGLGFAGDAQLPVLARGADRMVSYALDTKTTVSRNVSAATDEGRMTIADGVMRFAAVNRAQTAYTVKAPEKEGRTVWIEHPKMPDYKLVSPKPEDVETTQTHYRLRVPVKAGETAKVDVVLEREYWNSVRINTLEASQLLAYAGGQGKLAPEARAQFEKLAALRQDIDGLSRTLAQLDQKRDALFADQERIRENLKSLEGKSGVRQKYLEKLEEQEDDLEDIAEERAKLESARARAVDQLNAAIGKIKL